MVTIATLVLCSIADSNIKSTENIDFENAEVVLVVLIFESLKKQERAQTENLSTSDANIIWSRVQDTVVTKYIFVLIHREKYPGY